MIEAIDLKDYKGINKATEHIHVAVQYLSMAGEFLTEKKEDGSHANLGWLVMKEKFITKPFGPEKQFVMELSPEEMTLTIFNTEDKKEYQIGLKGKTQEEGTKWIKDQLKQLKIDGASKYKIAPPYDLPGYADFAVKKFKKSPKRAFGAFSKIRTWGEYFVLKHSNRFENAEQVRTWPHHFDHASLVTLGKNKKGELTKSMGLGLAIHDNVANEHYFYISAWQKDKSLDFSKLKPLNYGIWKTDGFKGAVLKLSEVIDQADFEQRIDQFFTDGIEQIIKLQGYKGKNGK